MGSLGSSSHIMRVLAGILFLSLALVDAHPQANLHVADGRIIGGDVAPKHAFPWQISLRSLGSHTCGGAIINQNQVLTAAHCVDGFLPVLDKVIAGAHYRSDLQEFGHQRRSIKEWEAHGSWNNPPFDNDIAIITVSQPFDFSDPNVQPIEVWSADDGDLIPETICNSTGWGLTNGAGLSLPQELHWIQIPVHAREKCEETFPGYITDGMICAGSAGHATCNGDSGGPFVCPTASGQGKLTGLVSFGYNGCTDMGVYNNVKFYQEWIEERLNP